MTRADREYAPVTGRILTRRSLLRRSLLVASVPVLVGPAAAACGGAVRLPERIVIAGGVDGGVYARYAAAVSEALSASTRGRVQLDVLSTAGSVDNLHRLATGEATFAICAADAVVDAANASPGPTTAPASPASPGPAPATAATAPTAYRAVARLYDDYIHLVVKAASPIHELEDLRGRQVAVGGPTSGTEFVARRILASAGLSGQAGERPLGLADAIAALEHDRVDAVFWSGGLPTERMATAARSHSLRLVALGESVPNLRRMYGPVYRQGRIPAETYAGVDAVDTVAFPDLLMTTSRTPDPVVLEVVAAMFAHPDLIGRVPTGQLLNRADAIFTEPVPLHPAALRYFRDEKAGIR
jgi:TRAP transporter TAXI family solute receptor